jgi:hypothetical protein
MIFAIKHLTLLLATTGRKKGLPREFLSGQFKRFHTGSINAALIVGEIADCETILAEPRSFASFRTPLAELTV